VTNQGVPYMGLQFRDSAFLDEVWLWKLLYVITRQYTNLNT